MIGEDKIRIKLFGFDVKILDQSTKDIVKAVQQSKSQIKGPIPLPTKITKYTVIRSPHVNKTSREQFEMRTHKRLIDILYPTSLLMDSLMKIELAPGVEVDIKQ